MPMGMPDIPKVLSAEVRKVDLKEVVKAQLRVDEGFRANAYMDTTGHLTCGYGWNLTSDPIRLDEAELHLSHDVEEKIQQVRREFPWFDSLTVGRQAVLVNMAFNLGMEGLNQFTRTLGYIKSGQYLAASREMLRSTWATQVGDRAKRLSKIMETGEL